MQVSPSGSGLRTLWHRLGPRMAVRNQGGGVAGRRNAVVFLSWQLSYAPARRLIPSASPSPASVEQSRRARPTTRLALLPGNSHSFPRNWRGREENWNRPAWSASRRWPSCQRPEPSRIAQSGRRSPAGSDAALRAPAAATPPDPNPTQPRSRSRAPGYMFRPRVASRRSLSTQSTTSKPSSWNRES